MSKAVRDYYNENFEREWKRLDDPYARIEFLSTLYLIKKYFPEAGHIFDVGSGPGRYSIELLKKGYKVSLLELSDKSLMLGKQNINVLGLEAEEYLCADIRTLDDKRENTYDGILLLGPMYHIQCEQERIEVLRKCRKMLKDSGMIIISYLNSWGVIKAGVSDFPEEFEDIDNVYSYFSERKLSVEEGFTECYFTTPPSALREVEESGFSIESYAGAESFISGLSIPMTGHYLENKKIYLNLLKVAAEKCEEPQYRNAAEHLLVVARK